MILTLMLTRVTVFVKGIEDPVQLRVGAVKIGDTPHLIGIALRELHSYTL